MDRASEPGVLIFDEDRKPAQKPNVEGGPRALFDDPPQVMPSMSRAGQPTAGQPAFIPAPLSFAPAQPPKSNDPKAVFADEDAQWRHLIRASIEAHPTLNPDDRSRAERMALQLFPIVEVDTMSFAQAALDASNDISRGLNELVIASTTLRIDDYLTDVTAKLTPEKGKGLLSRIGLGRNVASVEIDAIEMRLRDMISEVQTFRSNVVSLRTKTADVARRLALHGAAINAAIPHMEGSPAQKLAEQRSQLIAVAATTAAMTDSQQKHLEDRADHWIMTINAVLYTGIPNWRSLHATEQQKKHR